MCFENLFNKKFNPEKLGYKEIGTWANAWANKEKGWIGNTKKENTIWSKYCTHQNGIAIRLEAENVTDTNLCGMIASWNILSLKFGYIEIECKMPPKGYTYFPALWLCGMNITEVGWPSCNEIDIVELIGKESNEATFTHHWLDGEHKSVGTTIKTVDLSKDYHLYSIEWTPNRITWFIDRVKVFEVTDNIPQNDMYIICNIGAGGNPAYSRLFEPNEVPMEMLIKSVRVWRK